MTVVLFRNEFLRPRAALRKVGFEVAARCDSMDSAASRVAWVYCSRYESILDRRSRSSPRPSSPTPRSVAPAPAGDARALTIEQLIDIRHPSNAVWSPDGRRVAFLSERAGIANIFVAEIDCARRDATRAAAITRFADGVSGALFWSADSQRVYFPRQGDLWQALPAGGEPAAVWSTPQPETSFTLSPDGARVAFVRDGNDLVVRSLADGKEAVVVRGDSRAIGGVTWTPDGARLLFNAGASTIRHEQTPEYSGSKIIYTVSERRPGESFVVAAAGGAPTPLPQVGGAASRGWIDPAHFVVDRQSADYKRRTIASADTPAAR